MSSRIPWWTPQMTGNELERIKGVLDSNYLNEGEVTAEFERRIAERVGARHAVAVTSGTIAIFAALAAAGVGNGDEVIVPDLTFIATANAVTLTGATPVLVDIDPATLTLDPRKAATAVGRRTKAIVPVHVSGRSADMTQLCDLASRHGLTIVEDAAEAFVSRRAGRALGTLGHAGCLSFSPNKSITTGQGGMVLTDDTELAGRVRELKDQGRPARGTGGDDVHPSLGFNFKLTNLQSAVGLAQLDALDGRLERQRSIYRRYTERLAGAPGVVLPGFDLDDGETPLWTDALLERRDALDRHLADRGMGCRRFWLPIHTQAPYRSAAAELPNSVRAAARAIWLPSAFTLSDADVDVVCDAILAFVAA